MQKNIGCNLLKKSKDITYLNINRMLIIDFEIYLKYVLNMPLFNSILKNILLP
jgi:hypothetical protein